MKYLVELNQKDIELIIAERFDVPLKNVFVETTRETVGYGPMEHDEYVVKATVERSEG